jgi:hypothetical protein
MASFDFRLSCFGEMLEFGSANSRLELQDGNAGIPNLKGSKYLLSGIRRREVQVGATPGANASSVYLNAWSLGAGLVSKSVRDYDSVRKALKEAFHCDL